MRVLGAMLIAMTVVLGACSTGSSKGSTSGAEHGAPTPAGVPAEVAHAAKDWPLPDHDYANSRATTESHITRSTVAQLHVSWQAQPQGLGALTTSPLVLGDTIYLEDSNCVVMALDRTTGKVLWKTGPNGFNIGPFGVAVGDGRVYAVHGSDGIMALDALTGKTLWERKLVPNTTTGIDIQPQVFGGQVLAATVPISVGGIYIGGDHGVVDALDARTGKLNWTFDTVDSPSVWGNPHVNSGGGAWYPPAIDAARDLMYIGTANPAPFPGTAAHPNGSSRPGPNLYTDSIVALDLRTGRLRWYHQVTRHDIFDRDQVHATIVSLGDGHDVVVSAGKSGVVVGVSPDHGRVLWSTQVGEHHNDELTALPGPTVVAPGTYGGVLTPPAQAGGVVYLPVVNAPVTLRPDQTAYFGADVTKGEGQITAVDARTGRVDWTRTLPGNPLGGATVVNDLVFTALIDGIVLALDRTTGEIVWRYRAAGGINGWMSVAGDSIIIPVGNAAPPRVLALSLPRGR